MFLVTIVICRENELLKHQLKKYVGAVQMLRRDLKGQQSAETTEGEQSILDKRQRTDS